MFYFELQVGSNYHELYNINAYLIRQIHFRLMGLTKKTVFHQDLKSSIPVLSLTENAHQVEMFERWSISPSLCIKYHIIMPLKLN